MISKKIMPPTWLFVAILAMLVLHFLIPVTLILPPWWNLTGLVFMGVGVTINLVADNTFHRVRTPVKCFEQSSTLVTDGVFHLTRNPMYLGMVMILAGIAILLRSLSPYLVILAFAIFIHRNYVRVEEQMLAEQFGARWESYKANTRRWL